MFFLNLKKMKAKIWLLKDVKNHNLETMLREYLLWP